MLPPYLFPFVADTLPRRILELLAVMATDARYRVGVGVVTTYRGE